MTAPIGRIGSHRAVTREDGSDGHEKDPNKLDPRANMNMRKIDPRVEAKVRDVAKMYERQFLGEMFKAMRSTVHETDTPSMAQNIYQSQRDEQYIDAWSEKGGIGFSNIIYDQVMERFFGAAQGAPLKKQGMIPLTDREVSKVSEVKNGVTTAIIPKLPEASAAPPISGEKRTFENTEPMPAPTPSPAADTRSVSERVAAGEHFPESATAREPKSPRETETDTVTPNAQTNPRSQTALQVEVKPSPTGSPARIMAPWDATVVRTAKLDGARTAVTLEHGHGLRSTLVFDGITAAGIKSGERIPRGEAIGTLNADAKSFLWNLATEARPETLQE